MQPEFAKEIRTKLIALSAVLLSAIAVYFFYFENPEPTIVVPESPVRHEAATKEKDPDD